jgi:hypothetical protein
MKFTDSESPRFADRDVKIIAASIFSILNTGNSTSYHGHNFFQAALSVLTLRPVPWKLLEYHEGYDNDPSRIPSESDW